MPIARDGSSFLPVLERKGCYTVGEKGYEQKFNNYGEALNFLKTMKVAKWRRPNEAGNWGIVSAVKWVRT